jgi:hypothetical protein
LPVESKDKLSLFSIDFHEARNVCGQCCSGHALSEVLIPTRHNRSITFKASFPSRWFINVYHSFSVSCIYIWRSHWCIDAIMFRCLRNRGLLVSDQDVCFWSPLSREESFPQLSLESVIQTKARDPSGFCMKEMKRILCQMIVW